MKKRVKLCVYRAVAIGMMSAAWMSCAAPETGAPRVLAEKDAETFRDIVVKRETNRANFIALERLRAEKSAAYRTVADQLAKEHDVKADADYTYVAADKTLYLLSTNGVAKGKEPKKTVVKKFGTDDESLPLRKRMASRLQLENQLIVLATLSEESRQETLGWDAHLRKTFSLDPDARYQLKKRDDGAYEITELPPDPPEDDGAK